MNHSLPAEWWRPDVAVDSRVGQETIAAAERKPANNPVPFWALMSFTFILLIAPQTFFPVLAPFRLALLTAGVAIATHVYDRYIHREPIMLFTREMRVVACLVAWAVLSVPFSYWPGGSVSFLLDLYFKTLAIFWLLSNTVNTLTRVRQVAWALSLMAVPLGVVGVDNFLSGAFIQVGLPQEAKRIIGYDAPLTGNPNDLALMLNLVLPLSVALFLSAQRPVVRTLLLGIIFLEVIAVIVTFSRAGFLTLSTSFAMYLWKFYGRPERRWLWAALVVGLMGIPFLPSSYLDRLSTITDIKSDTTGSAQLRWNDMVTAVTFVLGHPIVGAGVGTNMLALNEERGPSWLAVHNVYLEYAVELGMPGLILFLLLLVWCIKSAKFVQQRSAAAPALQQLFHLATGVEISLIAFAVAAFFHPVGYHFYFYYIAGLAVAVKALYETHERHSLLDRSKSGSQ